MQNSFNLWERLKPEHKEALSKEYKDYPTSLKTAIFYLETTEYVGDLPFSVAEKLLKATGKNWDVFYCLFHGFEEMKEMEANHE